MIHLQNVGYKYRKIEGKQCMKFAYRPSYLLSDAKSACSSDKKCLGIYDNYCDGKPPFHLCSNVREDIYSLEWSTSYISNRQPQPLQSCVLEKEGKC